jgi:hypothetical protein
MPGSFVVNEGKLALLDVRAGKAFEEESVLVAAVLVGLPVPVPPLFDVLSGVLPVCVGVDESVCAAVVAAFVSVAVAVWASTWTTSAINATKTASIMIRIVSRGTRPRRIICIRRSD